MKKLLLLGVSLLSVLVTTGMGCDQWAVTQSNISNADESISTVTHLVVREMNPDDVDDDSESGSTYNVYLTANAARAEISETVIEDDLSHNAITFYFLSDLAAKQEYMFTYPNELTEADRAVLPDNHPLKQGQNIISSLAMNQRPNGSTEESLVEMMLQPILTAPTDPLQRTAINSSVITDHEIILTDDYVYGSDENSPLVRRTTINPATNLPIQVQLLDKSTGDSIETFVIDTYTTEPATAYGADFFTLEGWKKSLPGDNHVIIADDLN